MRRGSFFTAFLFASLFAYNAYRLSTFETVERVGVAAAEDIFDIQSIVEIYYPEIVTCAEANPAAPLVIPGMGIDLGVTAGELKRVPKEELGRFVAGSIVRQIYYKGFSRVVEDSTVNELNDLSGGELDGFSSIADALISEDFNAKMRVALSIGIVGSVLLAVAFFRLSPGLYKLTGFGGSFVVAGSPGIILAFVRLKVEAMVQVGNAVPGFVTEALLPIILGLQSTYLIVLLLGMGLFLTGMFGMFVTKRKKRTAG